MASPRISFAPLATSLLATSLAAMLGGCGTSPPVPVGTSPLPSNSTSAPGGSPKPSPIANLALEQVRLAELFRGTPVVFSMQQDGSLRATVPRRFSFDAGASQVKAPLGAVLDRLAKSQLNTASRLRVNAPGDPDSRSATLPRERANAARDWLVGQGISGGRVQTGHVAQTEQIEIVVSDAAR